MLDLDEKIGKRSTMRESVRLPGRLIMPERMQSVSIVDLSLGGANIRLDRKILTSRGILQWMGFIRPVHLAWQSDKTCGLYFDSKLAQADFSMSIASGSEAFVSEGWHSVWDHPQERYCQVLANQRQKQRG